MDQEKAKNSRMNSLEYGRVNDGESDSFLQYLGTYLKGALSAEEHDMPMWKKSSKSSVTRFG